MRWVRLMADPGGSGNSYGLETPMASVVFGDSPEGHGQTVAAPVMCN